jgi:hypothetical protein
VIERKVAFLVLAIFLLPLAGVDSVAQTKKEEPAPPIRQVDHILIKASDPKYLFSFFTDTLQLPIAWPVATYNGFTSGGVAFGNVNMEVIRFADQKDSPHKGPIHAQIVGFAFEPSPLADSLPELERRGVTYGVPDPYVSTGPDGSKKKLWTTVTLLQFTDQVTEVFLCEYNPSFINPEDNREQLRGQLLSRKGGPLGVESVREILFGTTDLEKARKLWQRLLESMPTVRGVWRVGKGPAIHLVEARENAIQGIIVNVKSLSRARTFLQQKRLLGRSSPHEVAIDPSKVKGLSIKLVENKLTRHAPNRSLDASDGSVFLNLLGAANGALIRAATSTQTLGICARLSDIGMMFPIKSPLQLTDLNLKEGESHA